MYLILWDNKLLLLHWQWHWLWQWQHHWHCYEHCHVQLIQQFRRSWHNWQLHNLAYWSNTALCDTFWGITCGEKARLEVKLRVACCWQDHQGNVLSSIVWHIVLPHIGWVNMRPSRDHNIFTYNGSSTICQKHSPLSNTSTKMEIGKFWTNGKIYNKSQDNSMSWSSLLMPNYKIRQKVPSRRRGLTIKKED